MSDRDTTTLHAGLITVRPGDALVLVDLQNDFLPGGNLPVHDADAIVSTANAYLTHFVTHHLPVFATRCWHPPDHCSFREQGGQWPEHCVSGTFGAAFPAHLQLPYDAQIVNKGTCNSSEAYSAFEGTAFAEMVRRARITRLFVAGVAIEYCVLKTASSALDLGFSVFLLRDASRPVHPSAGARTLVRMREMGVRIIELGDLGD